MKICTQNQGKDANKNYFSEGVFNIILTEM